MYLIRMKRKLFFIAPLLFLSSLLVAQSPPRHTLRIGPTVMHAPKGWRPATAQRREFDFGEHRLIVFSRSFSRGDLCYVEIVRRPVSKASPKSEEQTAEKDAHTENPRSEKASQTEKPGEATDLTEHHLYYKGSIQRQVHLHAFSEGWQGLFLIPPDQNGDTYLTWTQKVKADTRKDVFHLPVHLKSFPESKSVLPFAKEFVDPDKSKAAVLAKRLEEERAMKGRAFSHRSAWAFTNELSHPRDMHYITSPFYASRLNQRYKDEGGKRTYLPPVRSIHRGLDFRGVTGAPIFAIAPGTVVLAHDMHFEGGFTLVDHGNGIFTGYMHQHRIHVKVGDTVKAGQLIGDVGATGMVTGAHLHLAIWVQGIPGDPLSLLSLPLR